MEKPTTEAGTARPVNRTKNGGKLSPMRRLKDRCAKLAAANLALRAACNAAIAFGSQGTTHDGYSVSELLRAAVAKAEGQ